MQEQINALTGIRGVALALLTSLPLFGAPAEAAFVQYTYTGAIDGDCAVEALGGSGSCQAVGSFELDSALFGAPQHALDANFELRVNGVVVDTAFFPAFTPADPLEFCVEFCNQVDTDADGAVTALSIFAFPPSSIDNAVFLDLTGWSWDVFPSGAGVFSGADGASVAAVPVPASIFLMTAAVLGFGWRARRATTRRPPAAAKLALA